MSDTYNYNINQYVGSGAVDSDGDTLPANFELLPADTTYTWTGSGSQFPHTKTEVVELGAVTYTRVTTYANDGTNLTSKTTGHWVKTAS